ncbi:flagellar hook-length control protein FliK [Salinibacterium sp. dk2585]|uniref:flagellar hook-length control protein FliK n=1 Tax=unclassified Salinibacterium TaxID=2632331 RepID=UPI0011C242AB|nr:MULTISPECIES: flagellar hook-length control protein FliK [unclassified Salinibacterium]QEE60187.1 flagellar hook-length control protein FliK [Salinibacterium sp. dk2585]TXK55259.1 flagellar hook-length control protein FliK [Salinibacterium sp. dk5596]
MSMLNLLAGGITRGATSAPGFSSATDAEGFGAAMRGALADVDREWPNSGLPEAPDGQTLATHEAVGDAVDDSGDLGGSALVTSVSPGELPTLVPSAIGQVQDGATGADTAGTLAAGVAGESAGLSGDDVDSGAGAAGGVQAGGDRAGSDGGVTGAALPTAPGHERGNLGAARSEGAVAGGGTGEDEGAAGVAPASTSASAAVDGGHSAASTIAGGMAGSAADTFPAETARVIGSSASSIGLRGLAKAGDIAAGDVWQSVPAVPVRHSAASVVAPAAATDSTTPAAASVIAEPAQNGPEAANTDALRSLTRLDGAGAAVAPGAATSVSQSGPATAPALAPTPVPQDFSAQLAKPIAHIRSAGAGEHVITVNVTPENLGPVTVRAHLGADGMRIELLAPSEAGREALKAILGDLRRDLAGLGVATSSLSTGGQSAQAGNATLNLGDSQGQMQGGQAHGGRDGQPAAARNPGAAAGNHGDAVASETTHDRGIRGLATGIDVLA